MTRYLHSTWEVFLRYRHLLKNLVERDFKVKYRRSALGILWSLLNPILMMLIMTAVFSFIFDNEIEYFAAYLLCGFTMFNFFSDATSSAMSSVLAGSALIKKVYIPKYLFPLEKVLFSLINTAFSFLALFVVILITGVPLTPWMLLFPVPFFLMFFFNLGMGLILASAVVFFRDIQHLWTVLVLALNYLTPIFYPVSLLSEGMQEGIKINPLYWFVGFLRSLMLYGEAPTAEMWLHCSLWAAGTLVLGLFVIKKTQDRFILYM